MRSRIRTSPSGASTSSSPVSTPRAHNLRSPGHPLGSLLQGARVVQAHDRAAVRRVLLRLQPLDASMDARPFSFWLFPDAGRGTDAVFSAGRRPWRSSPTAASTSTKPSVAASFVPAAEREHRRERRARHQPTAHRPDQRTRQGDGRRREDVAAWLARGEPRPERPTRRTSAKTPRTPRANANTQEKISSVPSRPTISCWSPEQFLRALYQTLERGRSARRIRGVPRVERRDFPGRLGWCFVARPGRRFARTRRRGRRTRRGTIRDGSAALRL